MIRVYDRPLLPLTHVCLLLMDEVASCSVEAVSFFRESMTSFGLVRSIGLHINAQFLRSMSELAFFTVRAVPLLHKVPAERAFDLGREVSGQLSAHEM